MDAARQKTTSESESELEEDVNNNNLPPPPKKKQKRQTKYRAEWEKEYVWLESIRNDVYKANCTVCRRLFSISHGGVNDVKQHAAGENHKKNEKQRRSQGALTQFLVRQATPEANLVCQISMLILLLRLVVVAYSM